MGFNSYWILCFCFTEFTRVAKKKNIYETVLLLYLLANKRENQSTSPKRMFTIYFECNIQS